MKFIPIDKEEFKGFMKRAGFKFSNEQMEEIYLKMCQDVAIGITAANALGGTWISGIPNIENPNDIKGLSKEAAAALLAKELDIPACEIDETKALEYYIKKFHYE